MWTMRSPARYLYKFLRLPRRHRRLIAETVTLLLGAKVALAWVPFRYLKPILCRTARVEQGDAVERARLRAEALAVVDGVADRLPLTMTCFHRGIAAQALLRRRGVSTTLYYGAKRLDGGLKAHVWVQDGAVGVIGEMPVPEYQIVACFPETK